MIITETQSILSEQLNSSFINVNYNKKKRKIYNLAPQTASRFAISLTNCQHLDVDPPNYQKVSNMPILSKYAYNTFVTCHFSIKKKNKKKLN
jgi:hypothetical protein